MNINDTKADDKNEGGNFPPFVIVVTVLHCITLLIAFHMNIFVICLYKKLSKRKTIVDNIFLLLSITDVLICICLTSWFILQCYFETWILPKMMCPFLFLIQTSSVMLNAFSICSFVLVTSINQSGTIVGSQFISKFFVVLLICVSLIISLPGTIKSEVIYDHESKTFRCVDTWVRLPDANAYTICLLTFQYILPLFLMPVICNICCDANFVQEDVIIQLERNKKTKILQVAMVTTFAVGWFPQNLLMILNLLNDEIHKSAHFEELWIISNWFSTISCCIYPAYYVNMVSHRWQCQRDLSSVSSSKNSNQDISEIKETAV